MKRVLAIMALCPVLALGQAMQFDGVNDFARTSSMTNILKDYYANGFTVAMRVTLLTNTQSRLLGSVNDGSTDQLSVTANDYIYLGGTSQSNGTVSVAIRDSAGIAFTRVFFAAIPLDGKPHSVILTIKSSQQTYLYVDGASPSSVTDSITGSPSNNFTGFAYPLAIGAQQTRGTVTMFCKSVIYDFAVYPNVLTAGHISALAYGYPFSSLLLSENALAYWSGVRGQAGSAIADGQTAINPINSKALTISNGVISAATIIGKRGGAVK